jgi:hypothetical protein
MVAEVLWDEPSWSGILRVEKIEFRDGDGELARRRFASGSHPFPKPIKRESAPNDPGMRSLSMRGRG